MNHVSARLNLASRNRSLPTPPRISYRPMPTFQAHLSYSFRPGLRTAFDATYYGGGRAFVDGLARGRQLANSRLGATLALPLTRHHSLKLAYGTGATPRIGTDFRA